jgi:hypothetical protein
MLARAGAIATQAFFCNVVNTGASSRRTAAGG